MSGPRRLADAGIWLFLAAVCLLILLPIFWIVSTSLKPTAEILVTPTTLFPVHPTLEHYGVALSGDFRRFLRNSLTAAGGATALGVLMAVPAAWGFAKFPFPGSGALLAFTVVTRVFPPIALALPFFLQFRALGLGCRNDVLNRAAFNLGPIVGGGHLDWSVVESALMAAAVAVGLEEREAAATLRSGFEAGLKEPRRRKREKVSSVGEVYLSPEPDLSLLEDRVDPPPAFPGASVIGDVWGTWIADAARIASAPPDYVGMALLAAAGSLVGNARWVTPWPGWSEPPVVWAILIGNPSAGKSPALKAVTAPLRALERRVREAAKLTHNAWLETVKAAEAWEREFDAAVKAGRASPPRPSEAIPPEEPHIPRLTVNDVTTEVLGVILGRQPRGTLFGQGRARRLFRGHEPL